MLYANWLPPAGIASLQQIFDLAGSVLHIIPGYRDSARTLHAIARWVYQHFDYFVAGVDGPIGSVRRAHYQRVRPVVFVQMNSTFVGRQTGNQKNRPHTHRNVLWIGQVLYRSRDIPESR